MILLPQVCLNNLFCFRKKCISFCENFELEALPNNQIQLLKMYEKCFPNQIDPHLMIKAAPPSLVSEYLQTSIASIPLLTCLHM